MPSTRATSKATKLTGDPAALGVPSGRWPGPRWAGHAVTDDARSEGRMTSTVRSAAPDLRGRGCGPGGVGGCGRSLGGVGAWSVSTSCGRHRQQPSALRTLGRVRVRCRGRRVRAGGCGAGLAEAADEGVELASWARPAGIGPSGSRAVMRWVWRWSATSSSQATWASLSGVSSVGVDGAQRGLQPRCAGVDVGSEVRSPMSSGSMSPRSRSVSGPQRVLGEGGGDFGVFDDVGPVLRIQWLRASRCSPAWRRISSTSVRVSCPARTASMTGRVSAGAVSRIVSSVWRRATSSVRLRTAGHDGSWRPALA